MDFFLYSLASLFILVLIGLPIAIVILPRPLRSHSLVLSPMIAYCYITFISYYIYRSNIGGTDTYAWILFFPSLLLFASFAVGIFPRVGRTSELFDKDTFLALGASSVAWFAVCWLYFDLGNPLVALSISNLDVAELAVNSRYLQEFPRNTEIGFMGQSKWLQTTGDIIWFGPSLVVAFVSTLLKTEPYKLQSLVMYLLAAQGGGVFFLLARQLPGMNRSLCVAFTLLYALSPVIVYTAWQSFGAQMIAIPIILAIFYLHFYVTKLASVWKNSFSTLALFILLFSGLLVTYHFMAVIVFVLLCAHSTLFSAMERSWKRFFFHFILLSVLLVGVSAINPLRVAAIVETYSMLNSNNGWFIPWINPLSQLGLNGGKVFLGGYSKSYNVSVYALTLILYSLVAYHLVRQTDERPARLAFFFGLFSPILLAGFYFAVVWQEGGVLGSYRSFKITSTFCAVTLLVTALFLATPICQKTKQRRVMILSGIGALCVFSIASLWQILSRHRQDVYIIPQAVTELGRIEAIDQVTGLNISDMGNFTNLWANYFLLRKPHIFQQFPYGGRIVGPLTQPYTLIADPSGVGTLSGPASIFRVTHLHTENYLRVNDFFVVEPGSSGVTLTAGAGWWGAEPTHQWSGRDGRSAEVFLDVLGVQSQVAVKFSGEYGELRPEDALELRLDGVPIQVSASRTGFNSGLLIVGPGRHTIKILTALDPAGPSKHDGRTLGVLWRSFSVEQVELP